MHALDTDTKQGNITSNAESQIEFPKRDWFSLVTREIKTEGKSTLDAMMLTDRVYSSNKEWRYSTGIHKHRYHKNA